MAQKEIYRTPFYTETLTSLVCFLLLPALKYTTQQDESLIDMFGDGHFTVAGKFFICNYTLIIFFNEQSLKKLSELP